MVNFEIRGVDAVNVRMKAIANDMRKKFAMQAMAKAARIVTNAAKANADRIDDAETGRKISKNIQQRFASRTYRATGDVMYRIGVASPKGRIPKDNPDEGLGGPTPHWHLIELGTPKARAEPFLLPALATNVDKVTDTFVSELTKRLDKAGA